MLRIAIVFYLLCVLIYAIGSYLTDPKLDKLKLLKRVTIALLVGAIASSLLYFFVLLF